MGVQLPQAIDAPTDATGPHREEPRTSKCSQRRSCPKEKGRMGNLWNWSTWIVFIQRLGAVSALLPLATDAPIDSTTHHSPQPKLECSPRSRASSHIHNPS